MCPKYLPSSALFISCSGSLELLGLEGEPTDGCKEGSSSTSLKLASISCSFDLLGPSPEKGGREQKRENRIIQLHQNGAINLIHVCQYSPLKLPYYIILKSNLFSKFSRFLKRYIILEKVCFTYIFKIKLTE